MDTVKDIEDNIENLIEDFEKVKKEYQTKLQKAFKQAFKIFWDQNPKIRAVVWQQYTPYFNDGEPCEFGRHDLWAMTKEGYKKWKEDSGYAEEYCAYTVDWEHRKSTNYKKDEYKYIPNEGETGITDEECTQVAKHIELISKLPNEIFLDMFGDHVEIVASRTGFSVEDYEHD